MRIGIPFVHAVQNVVRLMNGHHGALMENIEVLVGNDRRDFNHTIYFGL